MQEHSNRAAIEHKQNAHSQYWRMISEKDKEMRDGHCNQTSVWHHTHLCSWSKKVTDEMVTEMRDKVIRAKAYLHFASPGTNSHLVKELKQGIREVERAVGQAIKDSNLSRR